MSLERKKLIIWNLAIIQSIPTFNIAMDKFKARFSADYHCHAHDDLAISTQNISVAKNTNAIKWHSQRVAVITTEIKLDQFVCRLKPVV